MVQVAAGHSVLGALLLKGAIFKATFAVIVPNPKDLPSEVAGR